MGKSSRKQTSAKKKTATRKLVAVSTIKGSQRTQPRQQRKSDPKPKAKLASVARKFEGASKSKRLSRWTTPGTSANGALAQDLPFLRNRSRDLRRNNPYAAKGIQVISSNTIGTGVVTQFRSDADVKKTESAWAEWAETTAIDFDGRNNIYGLQTLIMEAVVESGDVLLRRRTIAALNYPFQYQVLESDFLDHAKNQVDLPDGNFIIQGIEFNSQGKRVAYWLFETHPGGFDALTAATRPVSNRVLAEEIQHIYRMDRPGQARGVPWLSPVIVRLKDFDDYEDAQLMRQKIAACFTAFVRDISADFLNDDDFEDGDDDTASDVSDRLEPALIEELPRGKTIEFANPPAVQNYLDYTSGVLHGIASGLGVTYESLTGDYSGVNFSSGRMGWLEFNRNVKGWQERIVMIQMLDPIAKDFKLMMSLKGDRVATNATFVHVPPAREMIDPTREVPMKIEEIRSGLTTLSDALMERGKDPAAHLEQYSKDLASLDKLGIKLTSDPRVELSSRGKNKVTGEVGDDEAKGKSTNEK